MNIQDRLKQGPIPAGEALDYILQELAAPGADVYSLGMTLGEMVTGRARSRRIRNCRRR